MLLFNVSSKNVHYRQKFSAWSDFWRQFYN